VTRVIGSYGALVAVLIARRISLGLSRPDLDRVADFSPGFAYELENFGRPYGRRASDATLKLWSAALGLRTVDPAQRRAERVAPSRFEAWTS
jgi:hypothetical protein